MARDQLSEPDCLSNLEEEFEKEHTKSGYDVGFEKGKKDGQEDGFSQGLIEGAKRGSEVGLYHGCTMTWIHLLQEDPSSDPKSTKVLNKLNELKELVDTFPKKNETLCEDKLSTLRVKFKQATSMLNIKNLDSFKI